MNIYVCSPYGGKEENYRKAVEYCRQVAEWGHTPFASHVMLHGVLAEPDGRKAGLQAGLDLLSLCSELWVFGDEVTDGMAGEIGRAMELGLPVARVGAGAAPVVFTELAATVKKIAEAIPVAVKLATDVANMEKLKADTYSRLWDLYDLPAANELITAIENEACRRAKTEKASQLQVYEALADAVVSMANKGIALRVIVQSLNLVEVRAGGD